MEVSTEQILSEIGSPEAASSQPASPTTAAPESAWDWQPHLQRTIEYTTNGKKVTEPLEMVLKRAGLGYHAAQELHNINSQKEKYAQLDERIKALQKYEEYDKYAQENPEWHKHLQSTWEQREQLRAQGAVEPQTLQEIQALKKTLEEQSKFIDELKQARTQEKHSAEDKQFLAEIDEVKKNFGVDLDTPDENGESLAWKVTKHMQNMGLDGSKKGHFTMAFQNLHWDHLSSRQKSQAVEQHAKDQASLKKAGIRDVSRTPKGQDSFNGYKPGMSSRQVETEALEFLRSLTKT